ncbi:MAG: DNA polymerase III subunit chi [Pseudomonadota bacterium]
MPEVRFYHLTQLPLERALPVMLEKTLERGQRAVIRGGNSERLEFLNTHLWTYGDGTFLPHGSADDGHGAHQPIWLTTGDDMPNGAKTLFLVDGGSAELPEMQGIDLTAILFDGHDPAAVEAARDQWRAVTGAGIAAVYWAQEGGRWVKKHESAG